MKISDNVLRVLSIAEISADGVKLTGQLDRKLYVDVAKALEAAGAKWNRKTGMHVFTAESALERVEQMILTGEITTPQDIDYFPTPANIVELMISNADLRPEHEVLEPSAGRGAIALAVQRAGARRLVCIEKDAANVTALRAALGAKGVGDAADFMDLTVADLGGFDRIIMNPPFSKRADIKHIIHAFSFLKRKGRLVSIASAGIMFREDALTEGLRELIDANDGDIHPLPAGAFKSSGTMVNTVMICIDKP
jgi:predicted RNA methylase